MTASAASASPWGLSHTSRERQEELVNTAKQPTNYGHLHPEKVIWHYRRWKCKDATGHYVVYESSQQCGRLDWNKEKWLLEWVISVTMIAMSNNISIEHSLSICQESGSVLRAFCVAWSSHLTLGDGYYWSSFCEEVGSGRLKILPRAIEPGNKTQDFKGYLFKSRMWAMNGFAIVSFDKNDPHL